MKQRIQEALRRRHRKEDEGFTLIELLVVILIIAILAAVAIVALLGALSSGKKSAAKTSLTNSVLAVKSLQSSNGTDDFSNITAAALEGVEKDIIFIDGTWPSEADVKDNPNTVGVFLDATNNSIILVSRADGLDSNDDPICYYVSLDRNIGTRYTENQCNVSLPASGWVKTQKEGWVTP